MKKLFAILALAFVVSVSSACSGGPGSGPTQVGPDWSDIGPLSFGTYNPAARGVPYLVTIYAGRPLCRTYRMIEKDPLGNQRVYEHHGPPHCGGGGEQGKFESNFAPMMIGVYEITVEVRETTEAGEIRPDAYPVVRTGTYTVTSATMAVTNGSIQ